MQNSLQWPDFHEIWIQYTVQSTEYTYQLLCWNLKYHMDKRKINGDSLYECVKDLNNVILRHEAMNTEQFQFYVIQLMDQTHNKCVLKVWGIL